MSALINESDGLEENPQDYPDFEERMDRIREKMNYLLSKASGKITAFYITAKDYKFRS